jgi:hypothetical protein
MRAPRDHAGITSGAERKPDRISSDDLQHPRERSPWDRTQAMWMASSGQAGMQCSSLPQFSGLGRTASKFWTSRQAGPQAATQSPQPVQASSTTTGSHLYAISSFTGSSQLFSRRLRTQEHHGRGRIVKE